jgi:hypothetical protein
VGQSDLPVTYFFESRWDEARFSTDLYWRMSKKEWQRFAPEAVTRIPSGGFGEPTPVKITSPDYAWSVWNLVNSSWQTTKMNHPDAIWSPRDGAWYDHRAAGGGKTSDPGTHPARAALLQRLAEIERMYNAKPPEVDAARRQQLINQAWRDYEKQMGSLP